jgi:outer membrane protein TolC
VRARTDLAVILGLAPDAVPEVAPPETVAGPGPPPTTEPPPLAALLAQARKARPLVDSLRLAGRAADREITSAQGAYWPVLGLAARYGRGATELGGDFGLFGKPSNQYEAVVQATLALNLFAGGETRAAVERAEVQARRAQALLEQGEQAVAGEVANAREQVATLADSVVTVREVLDAAEQGLRLARERLEAGVGSQLEIRDAALKLELARLTWVSVVIDLVVARADLNRAVGGGL